MAKIVVLHTGYGCDTGCCGHIVEIDGEQVGQFDFGHPSNNSQEAKIAYARELVTEHCGEEHVADIDWANSVIVDY